VQDIDFIEAAVRSASSSERGSWWNATSTWYLVLYSTPPDDPGRFTEL